MTHRRLPLALCAISVFACQPEDDRLFDETGTWSMFRYALDGGALVGIQLSTQEDAFMLNFDPTAGLVAAAACGFSGSNSVLDSDCRQGDPEQLTWECRCFAYSYSGSSMTWTEYAPGDTPPSVGAAADTDGSGGGTTIITLTDPDAEDIPANAYLFTPLPGVSEFDMTDGVFQSDGENSAYVFQRRAPNLFVDSGCDVACFPGAGGEG